VVNFESGAKEAVKEFSAIWEISVSLSPVSVAAIVVVVWV
jgi:hypothetical protein